MTLYQMEMYHRRLMWKSIKNGVPKAEKRAARHKAKRLEGVMKSILLGVSNDQRTHDGGETEGDRG